MIDVCYEMMKLIVLLIKMKLSDFFLIQSEVVVFLFKKYVAVKKNESLLDFSKMDVSILTESCRDFSGMGGELNSL